MHSNCYQKLDSILFDDLLDDRAFSNDTSFYKYYFIHFVKIRTPDQLLLYLEFHRI